MDLYSTVLDMLAEHGAAAESSVIVIRCEQDAAQMRKLSAAADVRLIRGTDATVQAVRGLPSSPACRDVTFGDRQSLAALSAQAVLALTDEDIAHLANIVVRDVAWSLHQACSAPRALVWAGDSDACAAADGRFADALQNASNPLLTTLSAGGHLERLTWAQLSVAEGTESVNLNEAPSGGSYWVAASFSWGGLIQDAPGRSGGAGALRTKRSGWAR